MPVIQSAIKNLRKNKRNLARNKHFKGKVHATVKNLQDLIASGNKSDAEKALPTAYSMIDRAAKKNLLHKNKAARKKAQLANLVKNTSAQPAASAKTATKKAAPKKVAAKKPAAKKEAKAESKE